MESVALDREADTEGNEEWQKNGNVKFIRYLWTESSSRVLKYLIHLSF